MPTMLAVGGGMGVLNMVGQKQQFDNEKAAAAPAQRYSFATHHWMDTPTQPSAIAGFLQGAGAGAQMGAGLDSAQSAQKLAAAQSSAWNSMPSTATPSADNMTLNTPSFGDSAPGGAAASPALLDMTSRGMSDTSAALAPDDYDPRYAAMSPGAGAAPYNSTPNNDPSMADGAPSHVYSNPADNQGGGSPPNYFQNPYEGFYGGEGYGLYSGGAWHRMPVSN
jgi:hypothetical protein